MKILLINFLRLGDILMMIPVVNSLRKKYPEAEFHHLGFQEFQVASQVMPQIDQWHFISRSALQRATEDTSEGLLSPVDLIESKCHELRGYKFNLVVNLSHTIFSSLCAGLIEGEETLGAFIQGEDLKFSSDLFRILNEQDDIDRYHYLDWFRLGLGISHEVADWTFISHGEAVPQKCGDKELLEKERRNYLFQVLSSDEKKSWSREKWIELFKLIRRRDPLAELKVLCAPFEKRALESLAVEAGVELVSAGLKEAHRLVQKADIFITLDTSIKHLANDSSGIVVELSLGSSDYKKQSIYRSGSIILAPVDQCYPCAPKVVCPKIQRTCFMGITPTDVMNAIDYLQGKVESAFSCQAFITTSDTLWKYKVIPIQERAKIEEHKSGNQISENYREA